MGLIGIPVECLCRFAICLSAGEYFIIGGMSFAIGFSLRMALDAALE